MNKNLKYLTSRIPIIKALGGVALTLTSPSLSIPSISLPAFGAGLGGLTLPGAAVALAGLDKIVTGPHSQLTYYLPYVDAAIRRRYAASHPDATYWWKELPLVVITAPKVAQSTMLMEEAPSSDDTVVTSSESSDTTVPETPLTDNNGDNEEETPKNKKKGIKLKIKDKIKGNKKEETGDSKKSSWKRNIGKTIWETEGNNFGPSYKWRNLARTPLYLYEAPYASGYVTESVPKYIEYAGESFERGRLKAKESTSNKSDTAQIRLSLLEINRNVETDSTNADGTWKSAPATYSTISSDSAKAIMDKFFNNVGK